MLEIQTTKQQSMNCFVDVSIELKFYILFCNLSGKIIFVIYLK